MLAQNPGELENHLKWRIGQIQTCRSISLRGFFQQHNDQNLQIADCSLTRLLSPFEEIMWSYWGGGLLLCFSCSNKFSSNICNQGQTRLVFFTPHRQTQRYTYIYLYVVSMRPGIKRRQASEYMYQKQRYCKMKIVHSTAPIWAPLALADVHLCARIVVRLCFKTCSVSIFLIPAWQGSDAQLRKVIIREKRNPSGPGCKLNNPGRLDLLCVRTIEETRADGTEKGGKGQDISKF